MAPQYDYPVDQPVYGPAARFPEPTGRYGRINSMLESFADIPQVSGYGAPGDVFGASLISTFLRALGAHAVAQRRHREQDNSNLREDNQRARTEQFQSYRDASSRRASRLEHESTQQHEDARAAATLAGKTPKASKVALAQWIRTGLGLPEGFEVDPGSYASYANAATSRGRYLRGDSEGGESYHPILPEDYLAERGASDQVRDAEDDYGDAVKEKAGAEKLGAGWYPRPEPGQRLAVPPQGVLPDTTSSARRARMDMPRVRQGYAAADAKVGAAQGAVDQAKSNRLETQAASMIAAIQRAKTAGALARAFATAPKGSPIYGHQGVREAYQKRLTELRPR